MHDLALHFETINLDWIPREQNGVADRLARQGAMHDVATKDEKAKQPAHFKVSFAINKLMERERR